MSEKKKTPADGLHQCRIENRSAEGSSHQNITSVTVVHASSSRHREDEQTTDQADVDSLDSGIGLIDVGQRQPGVGLESVCSIPPYNSQERQLPVRKSPDQEESQASSCPLEKTDIQIRPLPEGAQSDDHQLSKTTSQSQSRSLPQQQSAMPSMSHSRPSLNSAEAAGTFSAQDNTPPATEGIGIKSGLEKTVSIGTVGIQIGLKSEDQVRSTNSDMSNGCRTSSLENVTK